MARPRTPIGSHGRVTIKGYTDARRTQQIEPGTKAPKGAVYVASTRVRDYDGKTRLVEASAATKAAAEAALKAKVTQRQQTVTNGEFRGGMTVGAAADRWLASLDTSNLAEGSRNLYRGNVKRYIKGSVIEGRSLLEANSVAVIEGWLASIATQHGRSAAKGARSVLSNTFALAVRYGALPHNAVKDARMPHVEAKDARRDPDRAFTKAEKEAVLKASTTHPHAVKHDLSDLLHFLAFSGARINEALTLRWEDVNFKTGQIQIRGTKTEFSNRPVTMSPSIRKVLKARLDRLKAEDEAKGMNKAGTGVVFHSPGTSDREKPRDRDNASRHVSNLLTALGHPWATSHTFRHTVVTHIIEQGYDIGLAADYVGHSDVRTTQAYVGRKRDTSALASIL